MEKTTIVVKDHVSLNKGITPDEAEPIFQKEIEAFGKGESVVLDFNGMEMLTTAFLNIVIGNLYKSFTSEELRERLFFENLDPETAARIKRVATNAKSFYSNEDGYGKIVEEAIHES